MGIRNNPYVFLKKQIDLKTQKTNPIPLKIKAAQIDAVSNTDQCLDQNVCMVCGCEKNQRILGQSCQSVLTAVVIVFLLLLLCNGFYAFFRCRKKKTKREATHSI